MIQIPLKAGHQRNIVCWLGSFLNVQCSWTSIAKKRYMFMIFRGGGGGCPDPLSPSGFAHARGGGGGGVWHIVNNNGILLIIMAIKPNIMDAPAIFQLGRSGINM